MRRFYKHAAISVGEQGVCVTLDGKPIRTPGGTPLILRDAELAEELAAEWHAQGEEIKPEAMPLTQLASTALDRVAGKRGPVVDHVLGYAGTDLLCYRAVSPRDLVERQTRLWQPILDWLAGHLDVTLEITEGVFPISQPEPTMAALRRHVEGYDDWSLTAFQSAVAALGSLYLALALAEGRLSADEAFAASQLDETYQIELWGEDPEATKSREVLRKDVAASARFLELCLRRHPPMHS